MSIPKQKKITKQNNNNKKKIKQSLGSNLLSSPVWQHLCWALQCANWNKTKEKGSSRCRWVLYFSWCFLIRVSPACKCRENLKRLCLLRISTNSTLISVYLLQTHSLEASKAGESSQPGSERCTSSCWVSSYRCSPRALAPLLPSQVPNSAVTCSLPGKKKDAEARLYVWGWAEEANSERLRK